MPNHTSKVPTQLNRDLAGKAPAEIAEILGVNVSSGVKMIEKHRIEIAYPCGPFNPRQPSMPPCSGQSRPSPAGGRKDAASLDSPCVAAAERLPIGTKECSRRGSNKRIRPKNIPSTDGQFETVGFRTFSGRC